MFDSKTTAYILTNMAKTVTIEKTKYDRMREIEKRYEMIRRFFELDFFTPPTTKNAKQIVKELRHTKRYTPAFLKGIEQGLEESSFFRQ